MPPKSKTPSPTPIHLEGTTLEGGGQLLRLSLGISALTKNPINITNIRGKRSGGGGLKAQHLTCVQWLGSACNARLSGVGLKSREITFSPSQRPSRNIVEQTSGEVRITQNTVGSIMLVLQAILPYLLFSNAGAPLHVTISGGTNVSNSPSYEYVAEVLIPMLSLIGIPSISSTLHSRGWSQGYTRIGSATFVVTPIKSTLPAFNLVDRGEIVHVKATITAPKNTEWDWREELGLMFEKRNEQFFGPNTIPSNSSLEILFEDSRHEKRYYILLVATTSTGIKLGRDWLYDRAVRSGKTERIIPMMIKKVSDDLLAEIEHGGCVDEFSRDQLVVFQALAEGKSRVDGGRRGEEKVEPSLHARTAMWVAEEMLGTEWDGEGGCVGVGFGKGRGEGEDRDVDGLVEGVEKWKLDVGVRAG
jgi:RNA 3'-terminal phosphate cyclase (ATP)